jgi:hypothetical protein
MEAGVKSKADNLFWLANSRKGYRVTVGSAGRQNAQPPLVHRPPDCFVSIHISMRGIHRLRALDIFLAFCIKRLDQELVSDEAAKSGTWFRLLQAHSAQARECKELKKES